MVASGKTFSLWKVILLLVVAGIIVFITTFNVNNYRETILFEANKAAPVTISFDRLDYRLTSPNHLVLENLHIHNSDKSLELTLDKLALIFDLNALFSKQVIIESLILGNADVKVSKAALAALQSTNTAEPETEKPAPLPVKRVAMRDFELQSLRIQTDIPGKPLLIEKINMKVFDAIFVKNQAINFEEIQLTSNITVDGIVFDAIEIGNALADFHLNDGQLTLNQLNTESPFVDAKAQATVNLLDPKLASTIKLESSSVHLAPIFNVIGKQAVSATGDMSLTGRIDVAPLQETAALIKTTVASLKLESTKLTIEGLDLDNAIGSLKDSQHAGLLDIGGFMLTGPIGLVAGQMLDLGSGALGTSGGTTVLTGFAVHADLKEGVVNLTETALATSKHRVAFTGGFDIPQLAFNDLTFSVLDEKGCASLQQTLKGSIKNPQSAVTDTLLGSLVNPLLNFAKKAGNIVDDSCKPVYSGQVKHPVAR